MSNRSLDTSRLVVFGDSLSDNGNLFRLIGEPQPPYFDGRFSNGPTYAEQLAKWLRVPLQDLAFGGATASDASPGLLTNPQTGQPLPINLPEQIAGYVAGLGGHKAPDDTTAIIYIGNNDYLNYLESKPAPDPAAAPLIVENVISSIGQAIGELSAAGVEKIALFTLPDLAITPEFQALGPQAQAFARALDVLNNTALQTLAATNPNVQLVDIFKLPQTERPSMTVNLQGPVDKPNVGVSGIAFQTEGQGGNPLQQLLQGVQPKQPPASSGTSGTGGSASGGGTSGGSPGGTKVDPLAPLLQQLLGGKKQPSP